MNHRDLKYLKQARKIIVKILADLDRKTHQGSLNPALAELKKSIINALPKIKS